MIHRYFKFLIYTLIIIFFTYDLWIDYSKYELGLHFFLELLLIVLAIYLLIHQFYEIDKTRLELRTATKTVENLQGKTVDCINQTLSTWQLTNAENEITWLIIKGFSFKEIAHIRKVSEKTIAQQAAAIYKKSNTHNRHELMSNFLDDFISKNS